MTSTLEDILKPTAKAEVEHARSYLRGEMQKLGDHLRSAVADIAFWETIPSEEPDDMRDQRANELIKKTAQVEKWVGQYNELERQLAALPETTVTGRGKAQAAPNAGGG